MSRINPKDNKKLFTDDVLNVLPKNENIKRGVANQLKSEDPAYRQRTKENVSKQWKEQDQTKRIRNVSKGITEKWKDPIHVARQKEGRKERYANPERCGNFKSIIIGTCKKTGKKIEFKGAKQMRDAGFEPGNIYSCLTGNRNSHRGYTWQRKGETND
jgi:hypothetical protein